jgi:hypothetical protein
VTTRPSSAEYAARVLEALEKTGGLFMIVQDIYPTFMMEDAHVVLPAAFNNGETPGRPDVGPRAAVQNCRRVDGSAGRG